MIRLLETEEKASRTFYFNYLWFHMATWPRLGLWISHQFKAQTRTYLATKVNSRQVVQRIQQRLHSKHKHKQIRCRYNNKKIVREIVRIYQTARYPADPVIMNEMLRACCFLSDSETTNILLDAMWDDLIACSPLTNLNVSTLLKLVLHHDEPHIDKVHDIIQQMSNSDFTIYRWNMSDVLSIFKLLNQHNHPQYVLDLFDSIPLEQRTPKCIGLIMQILIGHGMYNEALALYDDHHHLKDMISHLLAIQACVESGNWTKGQSIHHQIGGELVNVNESNIQVVTTLIDFYGHFGDIEAAKALFASIGRGLVNIVSIGSMMKAFLQCECYVECIELFDDISMKYGLTPNVVCYDIVLDSCTKHTAYHIGKRIHRQMKETEDGRRIEREIEIQTNLIHFYGKSGVMTECEKLLGEIESGDRIRRDIRVWNAMITAYGRNGDLEKAMECFESVTKVDSEMKSDRNTFIAIVNACSHCGDVEEGYRIWKQEIEDDAIKYDSYLVTAVVDCLARRGMVEMAYRVVMEYEKCRKEKSANDDNMWIALLSGAKQARHKTMLRELYREIEFRFENDEGVMGRASALVASLQLC